MQSLAILVLGVICCSCGTHLYSKEDGKHNRFWWLILVFGMAILFSGVAF